MELIIYFRRADKDPNINSRICSCHFINEIKENGPTIFSWNKNKKFSFSEKKKNSTHRKSTIIPNTPFPEVEFQTDIDTESQINSSILITNKFNDSSITTVINQSENTLLKIEIEKLHSQINMLKILPFPIAAIEENDSLITYYTGIPNKTTLYLLFDIFENMDIKIFFWGGM